MKRIMERNEFLALSVLQTLRYLGTTLSQKDQDDLFDLVKAQSTADSKEKQASLEQAMLEIITPDIVSGVRYMELSEMPESLFSWVRVFSNRLKLKRAKEGFTQEDLAKAAELPLGVIQQLENLEYSPSDKVIERLAKALGCSKADLSPEVRITV